MLVTKHYTLNKYAVMLQGSFDAYYFDVLVLQNPFSEN